MAASGRRFGRLGRTRRRDWRHRQRDLHGETVAVAVGIAAAAAAAVVPRCRGISLHGLLGKGDGAFDLREAGVTLRYLQQLPKTLQQKNMFTCQ